MPSPTKYHPSLPIRCVHVEQRHPARSGVVHCGAVVVAAAAGPRRLGDMAAAAPPHLAFLPSVLQRKTRLESHGRPAQLLLPSAAAAPPPAAAAAAGGAASAAAAVPCCCRRALLLPLASTTPKVARSLALPPPPCTSPRLPLSPALPHSPLLPPALQPHHSPPLSPALHPSHSPPPSPPLSHCAPSTASSLAADLPPLLPIPSLSLSPSCPSTLQHPPLLSSPLSPPSSLSCSTPQSPPPRAYTNPLQALAAMLPSYSCSCCCVLQHGRSFSCQLNPLTPSCLAAPSSLPCPSLPPASPLPSPCLVPFPRAPGSAGAGGVRHSMGIVGERVAGGGRVRHGAVHCLRCQRARHWHVRQQGGKEGTRGERTWRERGREEGCRGNGGTAGWV
ncbi:unnamed protein product [Closterium sp. NIES-53]